MKKSILISKRDVAELLGGLSESQVLRLVRNKKMPCIRLTRSTIRFELKSVKKWAATRPALRKTAKQQAEAKRRREEAELRKWQRQQEEQRRIEEQIYAEHRAIQDGQQVATTA
jgi:excisionase family DNA binding protein